MILHPLTQAQFETNAMFGSRENNERKKEVRESEVREK